MLPAAERQKHGDAWDEIAKAIPGRSATAAKARWETTLRFKFMPSAQGCAAGGGAKRPRAGWEDAGAERSRAAHRMGGKAMEMDDVEVSELDGAAAEHALNTSDWPGAAPESVGAGGHVGAIATMPLVPMVVDAVNVPVIATGGIGNARGFLAAFSLGALGVQIGTRFMATTESELNAWGLDQLLRRTPSSPEQ